MNFFLVLFLLLSWNKRPTWPDGHQSTIALRFTCQRISFFAFLKAYYGSLNPSPKLLWLTFLSFHYLWFEKQLFINKGGGGLKSGESWIICTFVSGDIGGKYLVKSNKQTFIVKLLWYSVSLIMNIMHTVYFHKHTAHKK